MSWLYDDLDDDLDDPHDDSRFSAEHESKTYNWSNALIFDNNPSKRAWDEMDLAEKKPKPAWRLQFEHLKQEIEAACASGERTFRRSTALEPSARVLSKLAFQGIVLERRDPFGRWSISFRAPLGLSRWAKQQRRCLEWVA